MNKLVIYTDGGSRGNPGPSAIGVVFVNGHPRTERAEQSSYDGENLEADQKSLAFHLIFQSQERTLTDNEINGIFKKIVEAIESEGWEVRG